MNVPLLFSSHDAAALYIKDFSWKRMNGKNIHPGMSADISFTVPVSDVFWSFETIVSIPYHSTQKLAVDQYILFYSISVVRRFGFLSFRSLFLLLPKLK